MNIALVTDDPRTAQYEPYSGATPSEPMPTGTYIQVRRAGPRNLTLNDDTWDLWDILNRSAQHLSAIPAAAKPVLTRDLVQAAFEMVNISFAEIVTRVRTRANRLFSDTFGGPNRLSFEPYPIRWPGESRHAYRMVMAFISAAFQVPQIKSNLLDHGVLDNHAKIILRPLFDLKANMMRTFFNLEITGEVSVDELDAVFRDGAPLPPLMHSFDDERDGAAAQAAEDAAALTNESAKIPSRETQAKISEGVEVWTFVPHAEHWTLFAEVLRRREFDGPNFVPAEPFRVAGGVVSPSAPSGGSPSGGSASLVTP